MYTLKVKKAGSLNFEEIGNANNIQDLGTLLVQTGYFFFPWIIVDDNNNIIKSGGEEE